MPVLYDLAFLLYALVYLPYLLLTRRWFPGFGMRFGFFPSRTRESIISGANIWVHAVSVGEVMVLDAFLGRLRKAYPGHQVIATVTTKTGYALAAQRLKGRAVVLPSPLDFSFIAGRFVSLIGPKVYLAVETEIWPNLYETLYRRKIPMVVINGRISDASFGRYRAVRFLLKQTINQVSLWCMQSPADAGKITDLGADPARVTMTGNMKFDASAPAADAAPPDFPDDKNGLWWVAGSTHPGEEEIVLDVYAKIIKENPQWRLVLAPRHVERVPVLMELVASRGLEAVKFSDGNFKKCIVVLDTIGHLQSLYALASLVFVGKTLCVGGGHNVIEPAFYGKAIIIGPRFENFKDIVACFKQSNAIVQVADAQSFETAVMDLCRDASRRQALGTAARAVVAANRGATQRILEQLKSILR